MESTKKNTLVFEFPKNAMGPSLFEMSRFGKKLVADRSMMDTCYRNADEKSVYIRFKTAEAFNDAVLHNPEVHTFAYNDGSTVQVKMAVAGGMYKYVRIFNLPPEISEDEIGRVLGRYGKIKKQVKEKFPPECEFDVYSGIRGVYMDIQKQIPASLFIQNSKARIYYDGFKNRCFHCKADDHLKVNCPQLQEVQNGDRAGRQGKDSTDPLLYANVAACGKTPLALRLEQARKSEASQENLSDRTAVTTNENEQKHDTDDATSDGRINTKEDVPIRSEDMEIDDKRNEINNGTKRALMPSLSVSDDSNDEQEKKGKTRGVSKGSAKGLPKRQKNNSTGTVDDSILEAIQNFPVEKEVTKNEDDGKGWSEVGNKHANGKRAGRR